MATGAVLVQTLFEPFLSACPVCSQQGANRTCKKWGDMCPHSVLATGRVVGWAGTQTVVGGGRLRWQRDDVAGDKCVITLFS